MGYILLVILAAVLLVFLIMAFARGKPPSGTLPHEKPVVRSAPSAEEANPSASSTATAQQSEHARRHTPPA